MYEYTLYFNLVRVSVTNPQHGMFSGFKNCGLIGWCFICRKWTEVFVWCEDITEHQWHHILSLTNNTWIWPVCQCNRQGRYLVPESNDRYAWNGCSCRWTLGEHRNSFSLIYPFFLHFIHIGFVVNAQMSLACTDKTGHKLKLGHIIPLTGTKSLNTAMTSVMLSTAEPIMDLFIMQFFFTSHHGDITIKCNNRCVFLCLFCCMFIGHFNYIRFWIFFSFIK